MSLPYDFDLQIAHIQALESREQVVGLFAALGYNTEARLTQTWRLPEGRGSFAVR